MVREGEPAPQLVQVLVAHRSRDGELRGDLGGVGLGVRGRMRGHRVRVIDEFIDVEGAQRLGRERARGIRHELHLIGRIADGAQANVWGRLVPVQADLVENFRECIAALHRHSEALSPIAERERSCRTMLSKALMTVRRRLIGDLRRAHRTGSSRGSHAACVRSARRSAHRMASANSRPTPGRWARACSRGRPVPSAPHARPAPDCRRCG